ncbi:hypothetical protein L1994_02710 [Methanomicrobium antiquum]|uniref:Yip1 domain-containing protein n=1 Tax=Methanomicrobium antiquum TaxID=487686 RepID=A0AAF0JN83_9EURY|nr:hypothetical protein [Methanomicrobium antiquum]WFN37315.1 hypothetical protein L1994_02710 [Methanomicrobium antiquum]
MGKNDENIFGQIYLTILDYLHLIYLFYRHPKQAFEIVNSGKKVHGIVFCVIYLFIVSFIYNSAYSCISAMMVSGFLPRGLLSAVYDGISGSIIMIIIYLLKFTIFAVFIFSLLWVLRMKPPLVKTMNTIFYGMAIAYPFFLIVLAIEILSGGIFFEYLAIVAILIYLLPVLYMECLGISCLLKKSQNQVIIAVLSGIIIAVLAEKYVLFGYEILVVNTVSQVVFLI